MLLGGWLLPHFGLLGATTQAQLHQVEQQEQQLQLRTASGAISAEAQSIGQRLLTLHLVSLAQAEATTQVLVTQDATVAEPMVGLFAQVSPLQLHQVLAKLLAGQTLSTTDLGVLTLLDQTMQHIKSGTVIQHADDPLVYLQALTIFVNQLSTGVIQ